MSFKNRQDNLAIFVAKSGYFPSVLLYLLSMAFERAKRDGMERKIIEKLDKKFRFNCTIEKVSGPREVTSWDAALRLMRNAISHSRVRAEGDVFVFWDKDPYKKKETKYTYISIE